MKKESLIAVVFGVFFGLVFSFIVLQSKNKPQKEIKIKNLTSPTTVVTPKTTKPETNTLIVNYPQDNLITDKKEIQIQGEAPKNSLIIVQMVNNEKIFENKNTKFTLDLSLNYGSNQIVVFAYPKNIQTPLFKKLTIYYLENKL